MTASVQPEFISMGNSAVNFDPDIEIASVGLSCMPEYV
jgi:hypothetical protein